MAASAVAASIISMAYQGIRRGEQRGNVGEGRMIHAPYHFRDFVRLSRDHGAHFWEDLTNAHAERLNFQKTVLGYDPHALIQKALLQSAAGGYWARLPDRILFSNAF